MTMRRCGVFRRLGAFTRPTPSFSNWADAGLIIDALNARLNAVELSIAQWPDGQKRAGVHLLPYVQDTSKPLIQLHGLVISGPLAIRAAALKWIEVNCK